jgi:acyl-CoA thioesterase I
MLLGGTGATAVEPDDKHAFRQMLQQQDVAELARYREANRQLRASNDTRPRIVLLGDSITYHWTADRMPAPSRLNLINRGVPGQTTTQMLLRFEDDVVALAPAAVVIAGGTNDLRIYAGDPAALGESVIAQAARSITAMADIAQSRGVKVVLCAVPPIGTDLVRLQRDPATLLRLNDWIRGFAASRNYPFVDFYTALADASGHLPAAIAADGLHPNGDGYRAMWPGLEAALQKLGP